MVAKAHAWPSMVRLLVVEVIYAHPILWSRWYQWETLDQNI